MYAYLMEPKLQKTIDGEFIEIRAYLCDEKALFIKLKSDVVLLIDEPRSSVMFLLPDKNGCYDTITNIYPTKPSLGQLELEIDASNLVIIQKLYKDKKIDRDYPYGQLDNIMLALTDYSVSRNQNS